MDEESVSSPPRVIIANASRDYRWRRYALSLFVFVYGLYSIYDGFDRYPRENDDAKRKGLESLPHPGFDLQFNQAFGVLLPIGSIAMLVWALYVSRGKYEFDGTTLSVPGHPPITVNDLREIDRSKWDRKGIAFLHYETSDQTKGIIKLDDFVYQRPPTDEIFKQIESIVEGANVSAANFPEERLVCTHCGAQNVTTALACINCGAPLDVKNFVNNG